MAELKAQLYLLEKEKKALELKLSTREAQEQAYLVHIEHLKSEVEEQKEQRTRSLSSTSSGGGGKDKAGKVGGQGPWGAGPTTCPGPASQRSSPPCCLSFLTCIGTESHSRNSEEGDILRAKKPNPHFKKISLLRTVKITYNSTVTSS